MAPLRAFTEHPASVGESYLEHLGRATGFGLRMVGAGLACLVHGFLPFLFVKTGSRTISDLNDRMVVNRRVTRAPALTGEARLPL
ncbi:MAG TPA: DUF6356 family protein [Steroidobacteraceae bacterium]|nr:DUF6356 family protein [Steroidobacteraceae bacterium]